MSSPTLPTPGAVPSEAAAIRQLIASGSHKRAVELAKELLRTTPGPLSEGLLAEAYIARALAFEPSMHAEARAILAFTPRAAAKPWLKLLESAVANAEHNHELVGEELKIAAVHADEGPTLKRFRPRAMGRATRIRKRTSHLSITLTPKES